MLGTKSSPLFYAILIDITIIIQVIVLLNDR